MLKERVISGVVAAVLLLAVLICPPWVMGVVVVLASAVALMEYFAAAGLRDSWQLYLLSVVFAVLCVLSPIMPFGFTAFALFVYLFLLFLFYLAKHREMDFREMPTAFFGGVYVCFLLAHAFYTRMLPDGKWLVYFVFVGAFLCDIFAYFVGLKFGKRKLAPRISPKKTVAGAVGGVLGAVISFLLLALILSKISGLRFHYPLVVVLGLLCGLMAELGDLFASAMKRCFHMKDFGNLMPGHGGLLDRCDSLLFVAPTVYYFVTFVNIIQ